MKLEDLSAYNERVKKLEQDNEKLRKALQPFSNAHKHLYEYGENEGKLLGPPHATIAGWYWIRFKLGKHKQLKHNHFDAAAKVYAETKPVPVNPNEMRQ